ncbi:MAG: Ribosomal RNA small subunit methyltransferase A [Candidatus Scalindua arabica]|uniref:Ribosomal RNA small subunit methyltransferase A n=1 Tax=Candidatus Scalindua arabica TaxID=1127984 RepID=A0A942A5G2_9BACT|nr:Ribosomal RNA small subunit methyltransferase A [Candidatus Scalindua arabica]
MLFEDIVSLDGPHTKSMLKVLFEERGIRIKKQWGQNFLIDQNLLQFIVKTAELCRNDVVLEIGAGTGSLTRLLAQEAGHVFAVEVDRKLFEILEETLKDFNNVTLINRDILKSKHHIQPEIVEAISDHVSTADSSEDTCVKVIANLPYYISTPVIIDLLQEILPIKTMILMLQRDTTDRIMAHPGTKDYGVLSIMTRLFAEVKVLKKLSPQVFWPAPLVDSAIVKMTVNRHTHVDTIRDYRGFQDVVRSIYSSRRKTLSNSLLSLCASHGIKKGETRQDLMAILEYVGIKPESRGEELEIEKLIELSNEISDYVTSRKDPV